MTRRSLFAVVALAVCLAACSPAATEPSSSTTTFAPLATSTTTIPTTTTTTTVPTTTTTLVPDECAVEAAPENVFDDEGFFAQHCTVLGIDVVGSADVAPEALTAAAERFYEPLVRLPQYVEAIGNAGITIAVIGADERITDLPPFHDLYDLYPGTDWRRAGRSFAATDQILWLAGAEENLLCLPDDRYEGEDMLLRELARTLRDFAFKAVDPGVDAVIEQSYSRSVLIEGKWHDTLAENNSDTYWMEAVQSYFDGNREADPTDGSHNFVNTRQELRDYDPLIYGVANAVFGDLEWRDPCG